MRYRVIYEQGDTSWGAYVPDPPGTDPTDPVVVFFLTTDTRVRRPAHSEPPPPPG